MANRNERRKRAKANNLARTIRIVEAHKAMERAILVKRNLAQPIKREPYMGPSSVSLVERNAGPSYNASREDGMQTGLTRKQYTAK